MLYTPTFTAKEFIEQLRDQYNSDRYRFDMNIAMYLSGDTKKRLRQEIVQELKGELKPPPVSKCGLYVVADLLKAYYEQLKLF